MPYNRPTDPKPADAQQQDITGRLSAEECLELLHIAEARRCAAVTIAYLEGRERAILNQAGGRQAEDGAGQ